ncbi:glutamate synthase large subunit [Dictyobacter formicarum]|uniref:Glutamate synthase n=1 Tax=Dictyobacter formicarum TaxID=2778368 RepID=A0ABQ3VM47_9CHLR|nr:glutamate synthase large subunit [Dictyobacter formicarum]GHO87272.1 glutamate synthase [Dictyobacter formicarum]
MTHKHEAIESACQMYPLYDSRWEHDACGTGFLAHVSGEANHSLVQQALEALARLTHRGAQDADAEVYDGAGILTQIPRALLLEELEKQQVTVANPADLGVGMVFLPPKGSVHTQQCRQIIEQVLLEAGLVILSWRTPPVNYNILGARAREIAPEIAQVLIACPADFTVEAYGKALYHARRLIEKKLTEADISDCYIASLSNTILVHKGLLAPNDLANFYQDLADPRFTSALAVFHQRYSTNTFPAWPLAQPMRLLAHNGEINTIQGNRNWMQAREGSMTSPYWNEQIQDLLPVVQPGSSDSAQLDNALEFLAASGRDLLQSMQMLVPPAWEHDPELDAAQRAWCDYNAGLIEPWDGPAALVFTDGRTVGAALDRNGLRPARYVLTAQGLLIVASEVGVVSVEPQDIVEKGRLGPGEMIAVDLERQVFLRDQDIKDALAQRQPYQQWLENHRVSLPQSSSETEHEPNYAPEISDVFVRQQIFGYTHEDVEMVLRPILSENKEPTWSMGDDAPLAVLSHQQRSFSDYFRQRFAQVTNPPIDPLRERVVMSLDTYIGRRGSLLTETPDHAHLIHLSSPILTESQLESLRGIDDEHFRSRTLLTTFDISDGQAGVEKALDRLEAEAIAAIHDGITLIILSDSDASLTRLPVPMVIAIGAVHRALIDKGLRSSASLICETGKVCDVHQIALVLGYGAEAIVPTLALESVRALAGDRRLEHVTRELAVERYIHVIEEGLCKIMARMGISTLRNIIGAGQFEVLGLVPEFVERCFAGSTFHTGKITYQLVAEQLIKQAEELQQAQSSPETANPKKRKLADLGRYRFRRDAEYHAFNPLIVRALQKAAQSGAKEDYQQFTAMVYQRPATVLRDLLSFVPRNPIPLDQVESMESIRARFVISAMSVGALSPETHQTIAAAMNSIGARNNTGEGGEDPEWYHKTIEGYPVSSKIKQVASARFGVTPEYLVRAEELEIKMAQGSKPGEGGQLPPFKVTPFIAKLRHTAPGVQLISPPPHHDIYSIEDIAQLIYDLHQINPGARVGVKLVSAAGVGTIAAGVAKGHANYVLISGHDGGTGASPIQSIKHVGMPWERGLAEAQQVLVKNGLRKRVKLRVDGGFKTGRDVIIGALLGAEEFGFGTSALVSLGCDMARQCHLNTCPAGIATQREDLRAKFTGRPQFLINYLTQVAEEVREFLAELGFSRLEDIIGRADLLEGKVDCDLDVAPLLTSLPVISDPTAQTTVPQSQVAEQLLLDAEPALRGERSIITQYEINNYDRSIGASLAGEIARRYGNAGLPGVSITCNFTGSAGQSFGAFNVSGMRLILSGDANDYVGKSMGGGQIIIVPPTDSTFASQDNIILGNTALYGATAGYLFAAGRAGERFAVRNSGAVAVVEGVGDHACEYMTAGMVVVLGETGQNFGAGMSSGVAYVLDREDLFVGRCNTEMVELNRIDDDSELEALRNVVELHAHKTRSKYAEEILANWDQLSSEFWRVLPQGATTSARDFVSASDYDGLLSVSH